MRGILVTIGGLALVASSLLARGGTDKADAAPTRFVVEKTFAGSGVACSSPAADNGAFALMSHKVQAGGMTYVTNQSSFPASMSLSEGQFGIHSAFATWNASSSQTLFNNGGTANSKPGFKDGVNTVGFGNTRNGVVATAYGWFAKNSNQLAEFDLVLSTNYTWATNPAATGDCGGAPGAFDVQSIVTHEAGHAVGLADLFGSSDGSQTMFGYVTPAELFKRTLGSGEFNGIAALYGTSQAPASQETTSTSLAN